MSSVFCLMSFVGCNKEEVKVILPTIDNMSGTWEASNYKKNGQPMSKSFYASDFIKINTNKSYSLHDSLRNDTYGCFHYGTLSLSGNSISFSPKYGNNMYHNITKIETNTFTIKDTIDNVPYECNYSRVNNPTTYQANNTSQFSIYLSTYCFDDKITLFCNHGYFLAGTKGDEFVYSKTNQIWLAFKYLSVLYMSAYPQKIISGTNNLVLLADTTKIIKVSSVKAFMIISHEEKNVQTVKDVIAGIK